MANAFKGRQRSGACLPLRQSTGACSSQSIKSVLAAASNSSSVSASRAKDWFHRRAPSPTRDAGAVGDAGPGPGVDARHEAAAGHRPARVPDRSVRPGVASLDAAVIGGAEVADSLGHIVRHRTRPLQPGGQGSRCGLGERSISYRSEIGALMLPASIHIPLSTRSTVATFVTRSTLPAKATRCTSSGSLEETGYPGHEGLAGERASGHRTRVMP